MEHGMEAAQARTAREMSPTEQAHNELRSALSEMASRVAVLESRLGPVLEARPPQPGTGGGEKLSSVPAFFVPSAFASAAQAVGELIQRVADIESRLQV